MRGAAGNRRPYRAPRLTRVFKPVFATIEQGLIVRTLGALSIADVRTLREAVVLSIG